MSSVRARSRLLLWVLPMLLITPLTTCASSQGLFGAGLPGLPSFGGLFGQNCDTCGPTKTTCGPLVFYAGWGDDRKGTTFSFDFQASVPGLGEDKAKLQQTYPVRGLWLGLASQANLSQRIGFLADGWVIVPSNRRSEETARTVFGGVRSRSWESKTDWWFVDGAASYDTDSLGKLLAGFRYDHFATNFQNPDNLIGGQFRPSDQSDVTINMYLPFVGVQVNQGSPGGSQLTVRIIGFPWFASDVKFNETWGAGVGGTPTRIEGNKAMVNSYFLEVFGEVSRDVFGSGGFGLFGRWNVVHGKKSSFRLDERNGTFFHFASEQEFAIDRQSWTLGASFNLNFNSPI